MGGLTNKRAGCVWESLSSLSRSESNRLKCQNELDRVWCARDGLSILLSFHLLPLSLSLKMPALLLVVPTVSIDRASPFSSTRQCLAEMFFAAAGMSFIFLLREGGVPGHFFSSSAKGKAGAGCPKGWAAEFSVAGFWCWCSSLPVLLRRWRSWFWWLIFSIPFVHSVGCPSLSFFISRVLSFHEIQGARFAGAIMCSSHSLAVWSCVTGTVCFQFQALLLKIGIWLTSSFMVQVIIGTSGDDVECLSKEFDRIMVYTCWWWGHWSDEFEGVHIEWFEHSTKMAMEQLGHPQEFFLTNI